MTNDAPQGSGPWRAFRLVPDDVLFFRDGRPAGRGDDHYHRSIFPPHPATLYGALRTRRLLDEGVDLRRLGPGRGEAWKDLPPALREELGEWGGFGTLELRGPWLVREGEALLPAPADLGLVASPGRSARAGRRRREEGEPPSVERVARFLVCAPSAGEGERSVGDAERRGGHSHRLALMEPFRWAGSGWEPWSPPHVPPRSATGWYLTPAGFRRWAEGGAPEPGDFVHRSELWAPEPRVGVAMEGERRAGEEGHLFTFGFIRLAPGVSLGFEVRGTALQGERRVRLGGEGRTCWLTGGPPLPATPAGSVAALRLALATPTVSERGAWPPGFAAGETAGTVGGAPVRLRAASVPGSIAIGGWDLARGGPKPLRKGIPAGGVFALGAPEGEGSLDPGRLHGTGLADYPEEHLARQGFGLVLAGVEPSVSPSADEPAGPSNTQSSTPTTTP